MNDREAFVALNLVPKLGPVRIRALLARLGSPQAILHAAARELESVPGVGEEVASAIATWKSHAHPGEELELAEKLGVRILTLADPGYPRLLREIHDPPTVLYCLGDPAALNLCAVAVVGTRKPSSYGSDCAKKLSYQLAFAGAVIVSGLARGVDTAAHQAALAARGKTVAVVGSGLARIYPPENLPLAQKIAASGAVISEFPLRTGADRQTFPMRNRIVSGMSAAVLVIEAGARSGALITATQAADQGRSIYAVPGRLDSPLSVGTNRLIQQGAKLVMDARDILDDLGLLFASPPELAAAAPPQTLNDTETRIFDTLRASEASVDEIVARTGLPTPQVSSTLLALELRRLVKSCPGGKYTLTL